MKARLLPLIYKLGGGNNHVSGICPSRRNFILNATDCTIECHSRLPKSVHITVYGSHHHLYIGRNVIFKSGSIWFEDNSNEIYIGDNTTIENASLSAAEAGTKLTIGEDCMLSSNIRISTTDSHSIIDTVSGKRTNPAASITIEPHVWIGYNVSINKGVTIGKGSVVAGNSIVTKSCPSESVVGGTPAKVLKEHTTWNRARI